MSFDFDELKHKAGNMLEKGKEKAHEAAERAKQESCLKRVKRKPTSSQRAKRAKR